ncbi:MAG: hypothetical protein PUK59_01745 [Actinomycetaceae bacterium]|nr:hypothetical protein [Actinomycetaceae bacterium]MDY5854107.1 hypothetical protein [Arcanobacterium sp.]
MPSAQQSAAARAHTLILMRHSEASYGGHDFARPLTARGRQLAALQGSAMAQASGEISLALVSSSARTLQTLTAMRSAGLAVRSVSSERSLYTASPEEVLDTIRTTPESMHTLLVLFHQPAVAALTLMLTAPADRSLLHGGFSPSTFALGHIVDPWKNLSTWSAPHIWHPPI